MIKDCVFKCYVKVNFNDGGFKLIHLEGDYGFRGYCDFYGFSNHIINETIINLSKGDRKRLYSVVFKAIDYKRMEYQMREIYYKDRIDSGKEYIRQHRKDL